MTIFTENYVPVSPGRLLRNRLTLKMVLPNLRREGKPSGYEKQQDSCSLKLDARFATFILREGEL